MNTDKLDALLRAVEVIDNTIRELTALNVDEVDDLINELENTRDSIQQLL